MSKTLIWPRQSTFRDGSEHYSPGEHEIDDENVDQYLDRGWVDPDATSADEDVLAEAADPDEEGIDVDDVTESDADVATTDGMPADNKVDAASDADHDADGSSFDAERFVGDRTVSELESALESGEYDDRLDTLLEAERAGQERSSAIEAIEARQS